MRLVSAVVLLLLLHVSLLPGGDTQNLGEAEQQQHKFGDHNEVHDAEHIKQHLEDRIDTQEAELNEEQRRFHYFFMHDLNKDNLIDGNEIIKAMIHEHFTDTGEGRPMPPPAVDETTIEGMVDSILREIDANNDGFLDYAEYTKSQGA